MTENPNKAIRVEKVTINIGCGTDQKRLDKAVKLIKQLTGKTPVKTKAKTRLAQWGLRKGLPIGAKLTLRNKPAEELLVRCIGAKEKKLTAKMFDNNGNISFGIAEYIDVPGANYDPDIGIMGFQITATLQRPGFRVKRRTLNTATVAKSHKIAQQDAIEFAKAKYGVSVEA